MSLQMPNMPNIPQPNYSWLNSIADSIGGAIQNVKADKSFAGLAERIQGQPAQQPRGFLAGLAGPQATPATAPVAPVQRTNLAPTGDMSKYRDAIASIESKGSGDYAAVGPTHAKMGRALGRYQIMESNIGPWAQEVLGRQVTPEEFMANPQLQDAIFDGKFGGYVSKYGPEGAAQAWLGGPGGVGKTGRKDSLGTSIGEYGSRFSQAVGDGGAVDAVNAMAEGGQAAYVDPMVVNASGGPQTPQSAQPQVGQPQAPMQVADSSGGNPLIAQGATPVQRGGVDPSIIQYMLKDRNLREAGLQLWAANAKGQNPQEPWQFVNLPDGTLARANQQTGAVENLGQFGKPQREYNVLTQEERRAYGIPDTDGRVYQRGADGKIDAVGGAGQTINVGNEVEARRAAAEQAGLSPEDPAYQGFILTGKLPRENEQSLTATDKKAILEADEMVQSTQNVLPLIDRALELNDKAYSGPTAGVRGMITGALGADGGEATQELDNVVVNGALSQLKAIFGGAPTEGERAILMDMSGASSKPAAVRKTIFERAKQAAQRRLDFYSQRANDMRGGTYYKPGASTPAGNKTKTGVQWSIEE